MNVKVFGCERGTKEMWVADVVARKNSERTTTCAFLLPMRFSNRGTRIRKRHKRLAFFLKK